MESSNVWREDSNTNIFGAPAKCNLDYSEIFLGGGDASRASPIPVLHLPDTNVGAPNLDYADIFAPLRASDYAVSFEDLIVKEPPRPPAYTRSPMEGSGPNGLQENQASSHKVPCPSLGEVKQCKMLHHQTNQGSNNGTTHIAKLHAVPGYTHLSDENTLPRIQCHDPVTSVESNTCANNHCGNTTIERICSHKSVSRLPLGGASKQISEGGVKIQRKYKQNKSFSTAMSFDENNSGLGTHPPKVPQPSGLSSNAGHGDQKSEGLMATKISDSKFDASEAGTGAFSPPYFGEEVDKNSVAAASAAAVKIAIKKAQARIKLAKQLMKKNKEGLQNRNKLSFKDGLRTEKQKVEKVAGDASRSKEEEVREICKSVNAPVESSAWTENENAVVGQVTPVSGNGNKPVSNKEAVRESRKQESMTAQAVRVLEKENGMETKEQFCEHLTTGKDRAMPLDTSQEERVHESMSSTNGYTHKEKRTRTAENSLEKPVDSGTKCKWDEEFYEWNDSQKKLHANTSLSAQEIHDQEDKAELEGENEISVPHEQDGYDEEKKERHESIRIWKNVEMQEFENENTSPKEAVRRIENDNKIEAAQDQEERTDRSKSICEMVTEVRRLEDIFGKEENGKRRDELLGRVENEKESEEPCKWEENEKQQKYADSGQNTEMTGDQAHKQEVDGERHNKFDEGGQNEAGDIKSEENEKLEEGEVNEQGLNEACQMLENEKNKKKTCERGDTAEIWTEHQREADEKTVGTTQKTFQDRENDLEATDDPCKHDENEHLNEEICIQKDIDRDMGVISKATVCKEEGRMIEVSEFSFQPRDNEKVSESVEMANDLDYNEMFDTHCTIDSALDLDEMIKQMKEANGAFFFNANGEKLGNIKINLGQKQNDQHAKESEAVFNRERQLDENDKIVMEAEVSIIHEEKGNKLKASHGDESGSSRGTEVAQQPSTSDRRDKTTVIVQGFESSQSTGINEENHCKNLTTKEKEAKDFLQKEVDQEKEHIKKLDEAKEKEKERIAVARAIREARGRAFVEARERAAMEKLAVGAQGKPMTEARERRVKRQSSADKEAKLRVERAAVERATSEARDRALGKSRYGNAASDARNQAEKFSNGSWDDGMRQSFPSSDTKDGSSIPSRSSRNSDSSNHEERSEEANSEVVQKSKAELERQQRTAERAAKVLAEKNKRDLLAQKEQAEKNRLAETLDADIKRWSSGKEGNLRALLSTLHYSVTRNQLPTGEPLSPVTILGPASGWQAVPLTDMIATAAVKKTYRRATLFVHPDKLQQRGADIQQKYMCEKVFDLLKDAWDRFNREER